MGPATRVPISSLLPANSPRLGGVDLRHAQALAEATAPLPPILVHRPTMRVIDGMHRVRAATLCGWDTIAVQFFDGSETAAFVIGVEVNVRHGLPLSLADRRAAAARIIAAFPQWSDRAIAATTGLAARTVGAIRPRAAGDVRPRGQASGDGDVAARRGVRVGLDGRVRPLDIAEGRRMASQVITGRPEASLREIAKLAGISPATARDVRERMRRGEDPVPARQQRVARRGETGGQQRGEVRGHGSRRGRGTARARVGDRRSILENLSRDPSLRYSESGRALLRRLRAHLVAAEELAGFVPTTPAHCADAVAELARGCAEQWLELAEQLNHRVD